MRASDLAALLRSGTFFALINMYEEFLQPAAGGDRQLVTAGLVVTWLTQLRRGFKVCN